MDERNETAPQLQTSPVKNPPTFPCRNPSCRAHGSLGERRSLGERLSIASRDDVRMDSGGFSRSLQHSFVSEVLSVWSKDALVQKRELFWELVAGGSTSSAACDAVGVNRRTGRRWRQPTGGRVPLPKPKLSGRYLSVEERVQIADLHLTGTSMRMIAVEVGRSAGTISRELARGGSKTGPRARTRYAPYAAQKQAEHRGRRPKGSKFDYPELASLVQANGLPRGFRTADLIDFLRCRGRLLVSVMHFVGPTIAKA